ncbi:MAG TPA: hypothetical protein VMK12_15835 [Anaeromyxobacteraceae bacterium]|nr:hypothetical protein [Anaeromyxobacteraceae bacterium]
MTCELQRAMARCEEQRIRYRQAVLASLRGISTGEAIRLAIRDFQQASAELERLKRVPRPLPRPPPLSVGIPGLTLVLRLLMAR